MSEPNTNPNPPEPQTPVIACCDQPDPGSVKPCAVCKKPTCKNCRTFAGGKPICGECRSKIEAEIADEKGDVPRLATAVVGGITGAIVGGGIWAVIALVTGFEVGYVALAVGWLAGMGTVIGSGGKKGVTLQGVAVVCSVLGLVLGKYFAVAHAIKTHVEGAADISYFDSRLIQIFTENFGEFLGAFDILWLVLALGIAYKLPAPTRISMSPRKD